jgi:hypothetical protein
MIRIDMRMKTPDLMGSPAPLTNGFRQLWRASVNRILQSRGGLAESFRVTMAAPGRNGASAVADAIFSGGEMVAAMAAGGGGSPPPSRCRGGRRAGTSETSRPGRKSERVFAQKHSIRRSPARLIPRRVSEWKPRLQVSISPRCSVPGCVMT